MLKKYICSVLIIVFFITTLTPTTQAQAQSLLGLPEPGTMVNLSAAYQPAILKGITVHKDNPFIFDFLVDVGQDKLEGDQLKQEGDKLIKYFLATLAVPEKDLWVNLSPYEKDRTVPEALGQTDMGRDLLAQDYILKQLTASLIYPEKELGKKFWDNVYQKTQAKYGNVNIPVNTFNKVWIMADRAEVFERNQTAFVTESHLKVMLEEDYLAANKNTVQTRFIASQTTNRTTQNIIKEIILPELEHEINTGKNFANLRQIFNSIILASWYKNNLKQSLLNEAYSNKSTVKGIDIDDKTIKQQIYERYLQAYKKGVFNYIKETPQGAPKKYFSGGVDPAAALSPTVTHDDQAMRGIDYLVRLFVMLKSSQKERILSSHRKVLNIFAEHPDDNYAYIEMYDQMIRDLQLRQELILLPNSPLIKQSGYSDEIKQRALGFVGQFNKKDMSIFSNKAMLALRGDVLRFLHMSGIFNPVVWFQPGELKVTVTALYRNSHVWRVLQEELPNRFDGIKRFEKAVVDPRSGTITFTYSVLSNPAMSVPSPTGGIDLKDAAKNTNVSKVGQGVEFELNAALIARIRKEGIESLTPVILKVEPVTNIGALVGLSPITK